MSAFRQVLSKYTSSKLTDCGSPNTADGVCSPMICESATANRALNFSLMVRTLCSLTHLPNRSLELLANVVTASISPTWRNHCNSGLSASRAQKSRCPRPMSLRAILERSASTLMRANRPKNLALAFFGLICRSASARLMNSCSRPELERIRSMRSKKARCSR